MTQPIVILGGFLSSPRLYLGMREFLAASTGEAVYIVGADTVDWFASISPLAWSYLLRKVDPVVNRASQGSKTGKVTLIGHSAGGLLARIFLSPEPFLGHVYRGLARVDHLVTLGSPHYNQRRWLHGGLMSRWVEERYPGSFFVPRVRYTSVAGKLVRGDRRGSLRARHAYRFYKHINGMGKSWGDGLVPVESALLQGSEHIVLDGVSHYNGFGGPWYGDKSVIPRWWQVLSSQQIQSKTVANRRAHSLTRDECKRN
jgi:pimeloyl-ACP methyl ester carboxylesterase